MAASPYQAAFAYLNPPAWVPHTARLDLASEVRDSHREFGGRVGVMAKGGQAKSDQRARNGNKKFAHVKTKISPLETAKYLERKKERAILCESLQREKELAELAQCTFRPQIHKNRSKY
jgi:hypothetical protein